jgi:hypothetical protein
MLRTTPPCRLLQLTAASVASLGLVATQAGAALPAKTVPPKQWAKTVCPALSDFVATFTGIDEQLSGGVSAPEAQEIIISGIEATIGGADDVIATIKKAGTPKTQNGKKLATKMSKGFADMKETLSNAQEEIEALSTGDVTAFQTDSQKVRDQVIDELDGIYARFRNIDKVTNRALNAEKACEGA